MARASSMYSGAELSLDRLSARASVAVPEPHRGPKAGLARGRVAGISGPRRGDGGELYDLRPFVEGDDPRMMDPAATARSGRPQLRRRHEEVERSLLLIVDMRSSMLWGTRGRFRSVAAAEAAAAEGWACIQAGGRCGLAILRDGGMEWVPSRPREPAMLDIAASLARAHAEAMAERGDMYGEGRATLADMLSEVAARTSAGTAVSLATGLDAPGDAFAGTVAAVARRNPFEILLVQDAVETNPPQGIVTARMGPGIVRGRFGASPAGAFLSDHGIPFRLIRSEQTEELMA